MGVRYEKAILAALRAKSYTIEVIAASDVTASFRRVSFVAPALVAEADLPPGSWLRLWIPHDGEVFQRGYTVTNLDRERGTFDIDFVLHEPAGVATLWARSASASDVIEATVYYGAPFAFPEPPASAHVFIGDPASIPAISEIVRSVPDDRRIEVLLRAPHPEDRDIPVVTSASQSATVRWVDETGPDGADSLVAALHELGLRHDLDGLSDAAFWVALDSTSTKRLVAEIKRHFSPPRDRIKAQGYWHRNKSMGTAPKALRLEAAS